jgi:hypothetical protein
VPLGEMTLFVPLAGGPREDKGCARADASCLGHQISGPNMSHEWVCVDRWECFGPKGSRWQVLVLAGW